MSASASVSPDVVSDDLRKALQGKMSDDEAGKIAASVKTMLGQSAYAANGSVASLIFYQKWQVNVDGGQSFNGQSGGIGSAGGGALFGTVYTNDINRLYSDTVSFQFNAAAVYTNVNFFDGSSNLLGTFQAGSVSTVVGVGGGSGGW